MLFVLPRFFLILHLPFDTWNLLQLPLMTEASENAASYDTPILKLPDHLLIEIFIRVPITDWAQISCVRKHWANLFRGEYLWQAALVKTYPFADLAKRWPGPIPRGLGKRYFLNAISLMLVMSCLFLRKEPEECQILALDSLTFEYKSSKLQDFF